MSIDVKIDMRGVRDIQRTIERLAPELRKAAYKAVISAGARVVLREAKARAPKDTGILKRSLGIKAKVYGSTPYAVIGPRFGVKGTPRITAKGKKITPHPYFYSRLVENGTARTAAKPFMRPALDASRGKVHAEFRVGLEKYLHRTARRLAKKAAAR